MPRFSHQSQEFRVTLLEFEWRGIIFSLNLEGENVCLRIEGQLKTIYCAPHKITTVNKIWATIPKKCNPGKIPPTVVRTLMQGFLDGSKEIPTKRNQAS